MSKWREGKNCDDKKEQQPQNSKNIHVPVHNRFLRGGHRRHLPIFLKGLFRAVVLISFTILKLILEGDRSEKPSEADRGGGGS